MPHPVIDWHVTLTDSAGNAITAGNPLNTTSTSSGTGNISSQVVVNGVALEIQRAVVDTTVSSTIVAAVPGKKIRVLSALVVPDTNQSLQWRSGTTEIVPYFQVPVITGRFVNYWPGFFCETAVNETLNIVQALDGTVKGVIDYVLV